MKEKGSKTGKKMMSLLLVIMLMLSVVMTSCGGDEGNVTKGAKAGGTEIEQQAGENEGSSGESAGGQENGTKASKENRIKDSKSGSTAADTGGSKKGSSSQSTDSSQTAPAKVCYVTIDGYCSGKAITLQGGDTAYSVLKRSGASVVAENSQFGIYVKAINGRYAEGVSGWMYSVNGVTPNTSAGNYGVKSGDTVRWYWGSAY